MSCLDDVTLSSYLDKKLSEDQRREIERHLADCSECLDKLMVAYDLGRSKAKCPPLLKAKIRKQLGLKETRKKSEVKWLLGALVLFALSFVVKMYFLQFLAASLVFAFKWVMEGEGAKKVVMIFRGIEKKDESVKKI